MNLINRLLKIEDRLKVDQKDGHGLFHLISPKSDGYLIDNKMYTNTEYEAFRNEHDNCICSIVILTRYSK